jgi:hypothetical protein
MKHFAFLDLLVAQASPVGWPSPGPHSRSSFLKRSGFLEKFQAFLGEITGQGGYEKWKENV